MYISLIACRHPEAFDVLDEETAPDQVAGPDMRMENWAFGTRTKPGQRGSTCLFANLGTLPVSIPSPLSGRLNLLLSASYRRIGYATEPSGTHGHHRGLNVRVTGRNCPRRLSGQCVDNSFTTPRGHPDQLSWLGEEFNLARNHRTQAPAKKINPRAKRPTQPLPARSRFEGRDWH